jgi:hypothetical protein
MFDVWPKNFVYLSPNKIDSLFEQIPQKDIKSIAKKVTVDLKLVKAEFGPSAQLGETIYSRLKVVIAYLERQGRIGSIDQPGDYFRELMPMRWGPFVRSSVVWFACETDSTVVGLGGSKENIVGSVRDSVTFRSASVDVYLFEAIEHEIEQLGEKPPAAYLPLQHQADSLLSAVEDISGRSQFRVVGQNLEFVARRILWGESRKGTPHEHVLLGTPLYVAGGYG